MATTADATIAPMTPPDNPDLELDTAPELLFVVLGDAMLEGEAPIMDEPPTELLSTAVELDPGEEVALGDELDLLLLCDDFEELDDEPVLDCELSSLKGSGGGVGMGGGLGILNSRAAKTGVERF